MMKVQIVLFFLFFLVASNSRANDVVETLTLQEYQIIVEYQNQFSGTPDISAVTTTVKFKRGKAIAFTVLTGLFGGHRIYFGTHQRTPIIYAITLGGLGVLPFIDLINIIFTKDLSKFENKPQIIMWGR